MDPTSIPSHRNHILKRDYFLKKKENKKRETIWSTNFFYYKRVTSKCVCWVIIYLFHTNM